jgi:predicted NBD/HSP70 family sugar kinase
MLTPAVDRRLTVAPKRPGPIGIAIDRGTIRAAAIDLAARVLAERAEAIPTQASGEALVARCAGLVRSLARELTVAVPRIVGVGIGLPGPVDLAHGGVHPTATLRRWAGLDVRKELSDRLDGIHVFPDTDANYGAIGEHQYGAGRGVDNLIYVRIGAGVGGGIIIDGQLHRGDRGFAGEIGHITAVEGGAPCPCGRRGCLSTVASTWAITSRLGRTLSPAAILARAHDGDAETIAALHDAGTHTGRVLSGLVNALNPGVVVLGGELGAGSSDLLKATGRALTANIQPIAGHDLRIEHARLGERSEVLGAGARVLRDTPHIRSYVAAA